MDDVAKKPKDYVIATGRTETVRRFVELSSIELGWNSKKLTWYNLERRGLNEVG